MQNKKTKLIVSVIVILSVTIGIVGCNKDNEKETATSFLKVLYETNDLEHYERTIESQIRIADEKMTGTDFLGIVPFDDEDYKEIYGYYIEKYTPFVTENGLEQLFSLGLITYMDDLAYINDLYAKVENIDLEKTEDHEYSYTVKLKLSKDAKEAEGECTGIVGMSQDTDGSYKVNFIKKTDSKAINDMIYKLNN